MQLISTSVIKGTEDFEGQKKKKKKSNFGDVKIF